MRDWCRELPPGTLICGKVDKVFALVLSISVQSMPGPWDQLHLLVLTSRGELREIDMESFNFYQSWLKVLT